MLSIFWTLACYSYYLIVNNEIRSTLFQSNKYQNNICCRIYNSSATYSALRYNPTNMQTLLLRFMWLYCLGSVTSRVKLTLYFKFVSLSLGLFCSCRSELTLTDMCKIDHHHNNTKRESNAFPSGYVYFSVLRDPSRLPSAQESQAQLMAIAVICDPESLPGMSLKIPKCIFLSNMQHVSQEVIMAQKEVSEMTPSKLL